MSMVRDLVDLYRGTIRVVSEPGLGSSFLVTLPAAKSQFDPEEISEFPPREFELQSEKDPSKQAKLSGSENAEEKRGKKKAGETPMILIVEDNDDLRDYIVGHLEEGTEILEAANGRVALELASERIPDLVISDLMMPEMDGVSLLQELKSDDHTCHIPFFMLTARDDLAIKTESFQKGTDEYTEKPFYPEELKARVWSMLNQRMKLVEHYRREFLQDPVLFINRRCEENFMNRIIECIRAELSNEEFSVSMLSKQMHISRVQLYRKVSAMTGFSPVEFIRNIRVQSLRIP
jgi:DNA-binding response OmpR family regulator